MALVFSITELKRQQRALAQKSRREKRRAIIDDFKSCLGCSRCGETNPHVLDFHHIDPTLKSFAISARLYTVKLTQLQQEMEKCVVLCANCHRLEHLSSRGGK